MCVLFIFAHPDDESFSGAGTAMKCAAAGARIVLVTATLGERGKTGDPPVCAPGGLAACRGRELRDAATVIGFDDVHLLGFRDKELADAPPDHIRRALVSIIRHEKPPLVLTFDPNGYNRHPDHLAIGRFTSDAVAAAADPALTRARAIRTSSLACSGRRLSRPGTCRLTPRWAISRAPTS